MKTCPDCKQCLPLDAFGSHPNCKDGRHTYCRPCVAARSRAWAAANREKIKARKRAYYETNKQEILAQQKAYYEANKAFILERERQRRAPEANRAHVKAWQKANPEKYRAQRKKRTERMPDSYIKGLLTQNTTLRRDDIPGELIAIKREQLKINRLLTSLEQAIEGEPK